MEVNGEQYSPHIYTQSNNNCSAPDTYNMTTESPDFEQFVMTGDVMLNVNSSTPGSRTDTIVNTHTDLDQRHSHTDKTYTTSTNGHQSLSSINMSNEQQLNTQHTYIDDDDECTDAADLINGSVGKVDEPSAQRLAKRLFTLDGFKRSDVAYHLTRE